MKPSVLRLLVFLAVLSAAGKEAFSCTYLSYPDPPIEYIVSRTRTVFLGKLISKTSERIRHDGESYRLYTLTFHVNEQIKGKAEKKHRIRLSERLSNLTSCDVELPKFRVGEKWIIFDGYDEGGEYQRFVRRNHELNWLYNPKSDFDLKRLSAIKSAAASPNSTLYGDVHEAMFGAFSKDGLAAKVELRSEDGSKVLASTVPEDNLFRFSDVAAGSYTVRVYSATKRKFALPTETETIAEGGDHFADFRIVMDGIRPQYENFVLHWIESK